MCFVLGGWQPRPEQPRGLNGNHGTTQTMVRGPLLAITEPVGECPWLRLALCECLAGAGRNGAGRAVGPFMELMTSQAQCLPSVSAGLAMIALEVWGMLVVWQGGKGTGWAGGWDQGPVVTLCRLGPSCGSPRLWWALRLCWALWEAGSAHAGQACHHHPAMPLGLSSLLAADCKTG